MSALGLEFIAGGAVALTAAVQRGYKQIRRDKEELAAEEDCRKHREAAAALDKAHRNLTAVWDSPLSLFDEKAKKAALEKGVDMLAVQIVLKARCLAVKAAGLKDQAEVYEAQFAERNWWTGVSREALKQNTEEMQLLELELTQHLPYLQLARDNFRKPERMSEGEEVFEASSSAVKSSAHESNVMQRTAAEDQEASMRILQDKGRFGLAVETMETSGKQAIEVGVNRLQDTKEILKQSEAFEGVDSVGLETCNPCWA